MNPVGMPTSNPFGAEVALGSSTSTPFGGQTGGSSAFGSGTAATAAFGATQPSTVSLLFAAAPVFIHGGSDTTTQQQGNPVGSPSFGQTQPAFGSSQPFGSTTPSSCGTSSTLLFGSKPVPMFGGGTSTLAFGVPPTPTFGSNTAFGAFTPNFGSSSAVRQTTPTFGGISRQAPTFGSTIPSTVFGAQSNTSFGVSPTPTFGGSFGSPQFGGPQRGGSRTASYTVTNDMDTGIGGQVGKFMGISAMPAYKNKSPEELRWEDYQAGDKGGMAQPSATNTFGTQAGSILGGLTAGTGQISTPNPFAPSSTSGLFAPKATFVGAAVPATLAFGTTSTSGATTPSPFGTSASTPVFGQSTSAPTFSMGTTSSIFGQTSTPFFGSSTFRSSTPAFNTSMFSSSTPGFSSTTAFASAGAGGLFSTPASSQTFGGTSAPNFGGASAPAFGSNLFSSSMSGSIFAQTNPTGLTQSLPSSVAATFGSTPAGQTPAFHFSSFQSAQQGSSLFSNTPSPAFNQQIGFGQQQPTQNLMMATSTVTTSPSMPQMLIGQSAVAGPPVQCAISSMPVSDKLTPVKMNSLLTPRHITQRTKVRMHARRYHPKKDSPKVSSFSDGEEMPSTPTTDLLFVPRESPHCLFIQQPDQSLASTTMANDTPDLTEIATPTHRNSLISDEETMGGSSTPPSVPESPPDSWPSPEMRDIHVVQEAILERSSKSVERSFVKQVPKTNGVREEHNHRGTGYISITGHRAGEAAIAYEYGADVEALMPKLRHSDYFTEPRIQELAAKERAEPGYCRRVVNFVVGRKGYGSVKFLGETDVRRLDLESIVQFNKCEVVVYMDKSKKPAVGQGLNKPAEVTLSNVKCVDKKTGQQCLDRSDVEKFEKRLKKKTEEQGAEFISYHSLKGEWKFQVKHFSWYGLQIKKSEDDILGKAQVLAGMMTTMPRF
ncbi:hypothetical protein BDL97_05G056600 [Sphagnum fallax]|nr:hypothetical protein BDL97_05G056600 [Sphagnum fallax]